MPLQFLGDSIKRFLLALIISVQQRAVVEQEHEKSNAKLQINTARNKDYVWKHVHMMDRYSQQQWRNAITMFHVEVYSDGILNEYFVDHEIP